MDEAACDDYLVIELVALDLDGLPHLGKFAIRDQQTAGLISLTAARARRTDAMTANGIIAAWFDILPIPEFVKVTTSNGHILEADFGVNSRRIVAGNLCARVGRKARCPAHSSNVKVIYDSVAALAEMVEKSQMTIGAVIIRDESFSSPPIPRTVAIIGDRDSGCSAPQNRDSRRAVNTVNTGCCQNITDTALENHRVTSRQRSRCRIAGRARVTRTMLPRRRG